MKKHDRQKSNGFKMQQYIDNDLITKKNETILKTYRKKYEFLQPHTFQSIQLNTTNMNKLKSTQIHRKILSHSKLKSSEERKTTNRISTEHHDKNDRFEHFKFQTSDISTKNKLMRMGKIMKVRPDGQILSLYKKIIENNEEYLNLIKEWKKLNTFDQNDLLIQKIVESYVSVIEEIIKKHSTESIERLNKYQQIIYNLTKENESLQKNYQTLKLQLFGENAELQYRILGEYQKNQWSTLIFNELEINNFNLQYFVQNSKFFKRWILSLYEKNQLKGEKERSNTMQKDNHQAFRNIFDYKSTIQSLYSLKIKPHQSFEEISQSCR